jgi:hypothetical protein
VSNARKSFESVAEKRRLKSVFAFRNALVLEANSEAETAGAFGTYFDLNQMADRNAKALKMLQAFRSKTVGGLGLKACTPAVT